MQHLTILIIQIQLTKIQTMSLLINENIRMGKIGKIHI